MHRDGTEFPDLDTSSDPSRLVSKPVGDLPAGTVTLLFTDVEGSTRAWEKSPELMARALTQHDKAIRTAVTAHNGTPVKARGEGEITKSLDFLETEMGDVPDRHRSIRAVFDYSWTLLSPDEQDTFAALSVFRGGFTRRGASKVAGASLRGVANLVAKSLIATDPSTGRYKVHALLRQYAEAALHENSEHCDEVQRSHAEFFASLTEEALGLLVVSDQVQMLDIIETDLDNIRAAWRYYLANGDGAGTQRMVSALYFAYELRGWYPAAVDLFDEAIDAFSGRTDGASVTARELSRAAKGWFMTLLGRADLGSAAAEQALATLPETTDLTDRWVALQSYAIGTAYLGDSDSMRASLDASFETYNALDDKLWVSGIKNWKSFAAILGGDSDTARRLLSEAIVVYEQRDEHYFMTWALWLSAMLATMDGQPLDAIEIYTRQVSRSEEIGYLRGLVVAYEGLGDANAAAERFEAAEAALISSVQVAEQMGMARDMLNMMTKIAKVRIAMGLNVEAAELLANICANPISDQQAWIETEPIKAIATTALGEVRDHTDVDAYRVAVESGTTMSFDRMVNQLLGRTIEAT
jgi:tetratricopeptide (TPR) repeat protein